MEEHLMYRNQLMKQIGKLQSVDVTKLQRQLDVAQNDLIYVLQQITEQVKVELLRNPQLDTVALRNELAPFERTLRGDVLPTAATPVKEEVKTDNTYDAILLQAIDSFDRIAEQQDCVSEETERYLDALEQLHYAEIAVVGDPYDETVMIQAAEVAAEEAASIAPGHVCAVIERGFIHMKTGAVLRKATVHVVASPDVADDTTQNDNE